MSVSEDLQVNGLSTHALNDGEFTDAVSEFKAEETKKPSALDLATGIEAKLKALMDVIERNDQEVDQRLKQLAARIEDLKKEM